MFVECEIEVAVTDRSFTGSDEHDLKLWVQRAFKANACYRISGFKKGPGKAFHVNVALNTRVLAEADWKRVESGQEPELMRWFLESMFEGKGTLKCIGEPKLIAG